MDASQSDWGIRTHNWMLNNWLQGPGRVLAALEARGSGGDAAAAATAVDNAARIDTDPESWAHYPNLRRRIRAVFFFEGALDSDEYIRLVAAGPSAVAAFFEIFEGDGAVSTTVSSEPFIAQLLKENEQSESLTFSRACSSCNTDSPVRRAVLTACGHAICLACAVRMRMNLPGSRVECPDCSAESPIVLLIEQPSEDKQQSPSLHLSRSCSVCLTDSPLRREVFIECGHAICLACAEKMKIYARSANIVCPYCRAKSSFVPLIEQSSSENQFK